MWVGYLSGSSPNLFVRFDVGRNLWIEGTTFSRNFTVLVWDNFFDLFPEPPGDPTGVQLRDWVRQVREIGAEAPVIYEIWQLRSDGFEESSAAYATRGKEKLMIEAVYDELRCRRIEHFPELQYQPPEWGGVESFNEIFHPAGLRLQAEVLAQFFDQELHIMAGFGSLGRCLEIEIS